MRDSTYAPLQRVHCIVVDTATAFARIRVHRGELTSILVHMGYLEVLFGTSVIVLSRTVTSSTLPANGYRRERLHAVDECPFGRVGSNVNPMFFGCPCVLGFVQRLRFDFSLLVRRKGSFSLEKDWYNGEVEAAIVFVALEYLLAQRQHGGRPLCNPRPYDESMAIIERMYLDGLLAAQLARQKRRQCLKRGRRATQLAAETGDERAAKRLEDRRRRNRDVQRRRRQQQRESFMAAIRTEGAGYLMESRTSGP